MTASQGQAENKKQLPATAPPASARVIMNEYETTNQVVPDDSAAKLHPWVKLRESLVGTYARPEAKPKLQEFLQNLTSGSMPLGPEELERYQALKLYQSHWIRYTLTNSTIPADTIVPCKMDYRTFLGEVAALFTVVDQRLFGIKETANYSGLAQSFTIPIDDLLSYKPETVKNATGKNLLSSVVAYEKSLLQVTRLPDFTPAYQAPANPVVMHVPAHVPPVCQYCKKIGHTLQECRKRSRNNALKASTFPATTKN